MKISKQAKDLIQKHASGLFKDSTLEFYGIKSARIKELINVELPVVEITDNLMDFVFLLEDDTYLHIEFQTSYNERDLMRFAAYDIRLYERDGRPISTVIIYTANVPNAADSINIGSLVYSPQRIMMKEYDGDTVYRGLTAKIEAGQDITDTDMLNLIFLPLMMHTIDSGELAVKSVQLAQRIPDTTKRNACIAAAFAFGSKYLNVSKIKKLLEALKMTDLATMLMEEAEEKRAIIIARRLFKKGLSVQEIAEATGLDESTVQKLQGELKEAV
jgi:cyanate lyase